MKKWTKQETELLKQNMGSTLITLKKLLPERTEDQILEKIKVLYRGSSFDKWTDEELNVIKTSPRMSVFELMKILPDRTFSAITAKRGEIRGIMGVQQFKNSWKESEIDTLKALKKDKYTNYEISVILGRPLNSVIGRLSTESAVGRRKSRGHVWTPEQLNVVREKVTAKATVETIAKELQLTPSQVFQKAIHLGFVSGSIITESKVNVKDKKQLHQEIKSLKSNLTKKNKVINNLEKERENYVKKLDKADNKFNTAIEKQETKYASKIEKQETKYTIKIEKQETKYTSKIEKLKNKLRDKK